MTSVNGAEFCGDAMAIPFDGPWTVVPADSSLDKEWGVGSEQVRLRIPVARFRSQYDDHWETIRFCNREEEAGHCGRYLTNWQARWITRRASWHCDSAEPVLFFRKKFTIDRPFQEARLCITAVNRFELYVNGHLVAIERGWDDPKLIDLTDHLVLGENTLAVKVMNDTPASGINLLAVERFDPSWLTSLLCHLRIWGEDMPWDIVSDASWVVTNREDEDWMAPDHPAERLAVRVDPKEHEGFWLATPGWVYAWERGRPPLLPWGHLPLFGEYVRFPVRLTYEVTLPPGTEAVFRPDIQGEWSACIEGVPVTDVLLQQGVVHLTPRSHPANFTIDVMAEDFACGVRAPIEITVAEREAELKPWDRWGLHWFSGRVIYRNAFWLQDADGVADSVERREGGKRRVELDLGTVKHHAEVWVNGKLVRVLLWPPYRVDISHAVRPGRNEVCIIVSNLIANRMRYGILDEGRALGWNRYWMEDNIDRDKHNLESGLLGPVLIRIV